MKLKKQDSEFRLPKITYLEYKYSEIDRTLLNLFPRLKHDGFTEKIKPIKFDIQQFCDQILGKPEEADENKFPNDFKGTDLEGQFIGFKDYPEILYRWLETDLLDLVNRGQPNQSVVSPRPLHGNVYKYRHPKHARDYGTAEHIFWMLYFAKKGQATRDALKHFVFYGLDPHSDKIRRDDEKVDVETQALLHFDQQIKPKDNKDTSKPQTSYRPLCQWQADLMAEDLLRLLTYEEFIPRSVLVDYIKISLSFHLALYHLRLLKLVPEFVKRKGGDPTCNQCTWTKSSSCSGMQCGYPIGLVVDMGDPGNAHMGTLAATSANYFYRLIPGYVESHFIVKKLDELASYLEKRGKFKPSGDYFTVGEVLSLLQEEYNQERESFFNARVAALFEKSKGEEQTPEIDQIFDLKLSEFQTYIEILMALRGAYNRKYISQSLDALMLKNTEASLLTQVPRKDRRFQMGSRLLEVLLQILVLEQKDDGKYITREIRVDELLTILRDRYGLYIDRLPSGDGFKEPSIEDRQALRQNLETFKTRLREIGFFQDLSDAYVTQTVVPRYTVATNTQGVNHA